MVVQFHNTKLEAARPQAGLSRLVALSRRNFSTTAGRIAVPRAWFSQWMKQHELIRNGEDEAAFAFRAPIFMQKNFRYVIPDNIPEFKEMVAKDPVMGDWHYTIKTSTGECWRLSSVYDCVMRMNHASRRAGQQGNWLIGDKGHHVRSLIFSQWRRLGAGGRG